ncbi:MAG: hypothetical protein CMJ81_08565 [Planctomycetaceae bacterium]|nr:hypothetical protein [Planctomycetaceae bacterium]
MRKYGLIILTLAITQTHPAGGAIVIENGTLVHQSSDGYYYDGPLNNAPYDQAVTSGAVNWTGLAAPIRYEASLGNFDNVVDRADCFPPGACTYESWQEMEYHDADATFSLSSSGVFQVTPDPLGDLGLRISNAQTGTVLHDAEMNMLPATILLPPGTFNFVVNDINEGISTTSSNNYYDEVTGSYDYSSYSSYETSGWVEIVETVLSGPVITIGNVNPGGTGVQLNPWNVNSDLEVGIDGHGTLEVSAGGEVSNTEGYIGRNAGSTGAANVSGPGASWEISGTLYVGYKGTGSLNIGAEGVVSNRVGYIGSFGTGPGVATVTGTDALWENSMFMYVGYDGDGQLNVTNGGRVTSMGGYIGRLSGSSSVATVSGADSVWDPTTSIRVAYKGNGSLIIEDGGTVTNQNGYIGDYSTAVGTVTVTGNDSLWDNSQNLVVGNEGPATLNIENGGQVIVGGTTSIGPAGSVNLTGGRFEFGQMSLPDFTTIQATGGALAGNVPLTGLNDVALLTALQNSAADLNDVAADNSGILHGSATLTSSLNNRADGEVRLLPGKWVRIEGTGNLNSGEINNFGGLVDFSQNLTNKSGGFIGGRGQFIADGGWTNQGVMAFVGTTDILGDLDNQSGGQVVSSGGVMTTFYDDVINNTGAEIRTGSGSHTVIFGAASGDGAYTGTGTVHLEGDLRPGNSPAAVSFGGDVVLGTAARLESELLGTTAGGEYDQLVVAGTVALDGTLDLVPLAPYTDPAVRGTADDFAIITAGSRSGTFDTIHYDGSPLVADGATDGNGSFRSHQAGGLFRSLTYSGTTVQLQNLLAIAGDSDGDGDVDLSDYNTLATNFDPVGAAGPHTWLDGNFDGDTDIDLSDYNSLASNFNPGGYGSAAVPEPGALLLALLALVSWSGRLPAPR